jgi:NADH dehydrogenase
VESIDPATKTVTLASGGTLTGDHVVLAAGSQANFFGTPGAEHVFPLYSLHDAERLRDRILAVFEDAERDATRVDEGALNFVVVGAGATGTEVSGALAELIRRVLPSRFHDLALDHARVIMVDPGEAVLGPFSPKAHDYASKVLQRDGVEIRLGTAVNEVAADHVVLSDGGTIPTRCVIWGGGIKAAPLAGHSGLQQGHGGRIDVQPDLTVPGRPGIYAVGDIANIPDPDGNPYPQLGSVALQAGTWAAKNILADVAGEERTAFDYHDKGIMAMIGRNAAVAEMGAHRHELHGAVAFAAWLGIHAWLMSGVRQRVDAFVSWAWDYFGKTRESEALDSSDTARIDWEEDDDA